MAPTVSAPHSTAVIDISKINNNTNPKWWKDPGLRKLAPVLAMGKFEASDIVSSYQS